MRVRAPTLGFLLWLLGACATPVQPLSLQPSGEVRSGDYDEVLGRWTRSDKVYDQVHSVMFVHATFHSPEFRRAFALRHRDIYGPGSEEAARLSLTAEGAEDTLEFFISAWTADNRWNDFAQTDSIWRITLSGLAPDAERVAGEVRRIRKSANLRVIYPYVTDFARCYSVRFPRTTPSGEPLITSASRGFVVRISSGLGEAMLSWDLQPTAAQP